ncbi:translin-like [Branchiostoma floridae]|uniref:Translin n=1 Tax=Branchiostoma floridae TaxID=7739 RepID=C3Z9P2_BRAFL|nr:translin-like [Branchiostoma floridae]|eukprot:XP_002594727.1 hypothetical protein BRAFLDRAFT_114633 [Branchiostoma floridae]
MASAPTQETFSKFQEYLTKDQDIREEIRASVREIEQTAREILTVLQGVHQPTGCKDTVSICKRSREMFTNIRRQYSELAAKLPAEQYYRFHDHWRFANQRCVFLAAFLVYLESDKLITREEAAELLGVKERREDGFHIDLDDFLMGLLQLANELSRLAVNSVTAGDYSRPTKIANFVAELDAGFRLLNLKNDALRKRFDGLKYDVKKIEEVVYDVTIRGLNPPPAQKPEAPTEEQ